MLELKFNIDTMYNKIYPHERGPMGGAPYLGPRLGDGPIFEVSVLHLDANKAYMSISS